MPDTKHVEDDVRELTDKGEDDRTDPIGDEDISELIQAHPALQRHIDRRVTEGIKTYAAHQKKKADQQADEVTDEDDGATPGDAVHNTDENKEDPNQPDPLERIAVEAARIQQGLDLEKELRARGLDCFAGLVQDPSTIDDLERAAGEYLRSKNLGADLAPQRSVVSNVTLSALESHIAQSLGIDLEQYAKRKTELEQKEGVA